MPIHRDVAQFVHNQEPRLAVKLQLLFQPVLRVGLRQGPDQSRGRLEQDPVPLLDRLHPQGHGQVCLAHTRGPHQDDVFRRFDVAAPGQFPDLTGVQGRLETEVEGFQGLHVGQPRHRRPHLDVLVRLRRHFLAQEAFQKVREGQVLLGRLL